MGLLKCRKCGGYNSPTEWPEEERVNFNPELCYNCARNSSVESADAKEEEPDDVDDDADGIRAMEDAEKSVEEGDDDED